MKHEMKVIRSFHKKIGVKTSESRGGSQRSVLKALSRIGLQMEELGELTEAIMKNLGIEKIAEEIADNLIVILGTADSFGIDIDVEFRKKMAYNLKKSGAMTEFGKAIDDVK